MKKFYANSLSWQLPDIFNQPAAKNEIMNLKITDKTLVGEVQNHFNKTYPNLKLEFYYPSIKNSPARMKMSANELITRFAALNGKGGAEINMDGNSTVAQLESDFKDRIQVDVQVLRRLGRIWVDISYTDQWTLYSQNAESDNMDKEDTWLF